MEQFLALFDFLQNLDLVVVDLVLRGVVQRFNLFVIMRLDLLRKIESLITFNGFMSL